MGCQASSNQIVSDPAEISPELMIPSPGPINVKRSEHRISPENILTGNSPISFHKQSTKLHISQKITLEPISTSVLKTIHNLQSDLSIHKQPQGKALKAQTKASEDSTNPSRLGYSENDNNKKKARKMKKKRKQLEPLQKELKRLYGL